MVLGIDRVTIAVNDMDAMVAFYNAVFSAELRPVEPSAEFTFYMGKLGPLELFFCPNVITQIVAEKNRQQFRFVVENVEVTIAAGVRAGGTKLGDIQAADHAIAGGLSDPDGNSIELIQYR